MHDISVFNFTYWARLKQGENATDYIHAEDDSDEYILELAFVRITFIILYTIVFFLCVFGNFIVLLAVTMHWRMRHRLTKFCLANLALADLCVGIFCVYQNLSTYFVDNWILGDFLCKMYLFINGTSHTASVLTLVAVCVEQYFAVITPLKFKEVLTKGRLKVLVGMVWLVSGLYCSPRLYYLGTIVIPLDMSGTEKGIICAPQREFYDTQMFDVINSIFLFLVPLGLMMILYTRVGLVLWGSSANQIPLSNNVPARSIFTDPGSTETETFGISPYDRIIERPIGKNLKIFHPTAQRLTKLSKHSRSHSSPNLISHHLRRRSPDLLSASNVSHNNVCINNVSHRRILSTQKHRTGTKYGLPTQKGINGLRRTYFLKKIQAQKQLQLEKDFLRGEHELQVRRSVVKMLIVIVVTFAFCNFPYHWRKLAIYWFPSYSYGSPWGTLTLLLCSLFMYGNCAINPIIYASMSSSFRACIIDVLHCQWRSPVRVDASQTLGSSFVQRPMFRSNVSFREGEV